MRSRMLLAILLLGFLQVAAIRPAQAAGECLIYDIDATTTTWGGTYSYEGVLVVFPEPIITETGTSTVANQWEFWFQIGKPTTNPTPGAIYFATNSAITNTTTQAAAQLQLADITWNDDGYFEVAPRLYESQQMINLFNTDGGVTAQVYTVTAGVMGIQFSEDFEELHAEVRFVGRSMYTVGQRADTPYEAVIEGEFVETSTRCITSGR